MQPYFFPYIGYFQLMDAADEFVVYDNIEFSKGGWINRNRILTNGKDSFITLPLKKDSDFLDIRERCLADVWSRERKKILNRIAESYRKSPQFDPVYSLIEECILFNETNLFNFLLNSLIQTKKYLDIKTPLIPASKILVDHGLKSEEKVIAICKARKADVYFNSIGGARLYQNDHFESAGISLRFLRALDIRYQQFEGGFVPSLSIVDMMMFNPKETIKEYLKLFHIFKQDAAIESLESSFAKRR